MITRRRFLLGSTSAAAILMASPALTASHGISPLTNSNTIINIGGGDYALFNGAFLNLAKWVQPTSPDVGWLGQFSGTNGYPNGSFTSNLQSLGIWDPTYYGHYVFSFSGQGGVGPISGNPVIVYSGASASGVTVSGISPADKGEVPGNFQTIATSGCNIECAFGLLIQAVSVSTSGNAGGVGLVKFTSQGSNYVGNLPTGTTVQLNNLTGLPTGPNSDGSWTINQIDNNNFSLQGSSAFAGLVSITASGGPGVQTEAIYAASGNFNLPGTTYSSFSNFIFCAKSDLADIQAGKLAKASFVNAVAASKCSYVRFMDMVPVQLTQGIAAFSDRVTPNSLIWGPVTCPNGYWAGQLTNTSDAFTCSNPANSPSSGGYLDGEVVVAQVGASGQNTTQNPTLALSGRSGAAPVYSDHCGLKNLTFGGTIPATGTIISIVFTGGGLSSAHTVHYMVTSADHSDSSFGTLNGNVRNAINTDTTLAAQNITAQNTTVPGLGNALSMAFYYNQNINSSGAAQLGAGMSISASDNGGITTYSVGLVVAGYLANSNFVTFTYNVLLNGWITTPWSGNIGGVRGGPPLEYLEELCSRANAGIWYNFGITASSSVIFNTVTHIANSSVKGLVCEFSNETWNNQLSQWGPCQSLAQSLGLFAGGLNSYTGLRIIQMAQQATAAWAAAGRPRSQLKIANAYQFVDLAPPQFSGSIVYRFNGTELNASGSGTNVTLKAFGGPANGTATPTALTTDFSSAPSRPADWSDWVSPAPYWEGAQFNSAQGGLNTGVPLSAYNGSLLAAYNYVYGAPTQQQAALDFLYSISTGNGDLYNGLLNGTAFPSPGEQVGAWVLGAPTGGAAGYFGVGTVVAGYDSSRSSTGTSGGAQLKLGVGCYEGGWQAGPVDNVSNVASSLSGLGYGTGYSSSLSGAASGGPTGASDTPTNAANCLAVLLNGNALGQFTLVGTPNTNLTGWKNDTRAFTLLLRGYNDFKAAVNTVSARDAFPCQYGFEGPQIWGCYPGTPTQSGPFQVINALAAFN